MAAENQKETAVETEAAQPAETEAPNENTEAAAPAQTESSEAETEPVQPAETPVTETEDANIRISRRIP